MERKYLWVIVALCLSGSAQASSYLFTNGYLLTMNGDAVMAGDVLVEAGRIVAVGGEMEVADDAQLIDMQGGYLMPGLAEMHAHVPRHDREPEYAQDVLFLWVAHGITTVRGMLGHASHLKLREGLGELLVLGPRLITSGPSFNGSSVTSPEQAAEMVREQHAAGYDFLKIHPGLTRAEYDAMAETATDVGISFAGHVPVDVGLLRALEQGQATLDHVDGYVHALVPGLTPETPGYGSSFGVRLVDQVDLTGLAALIEATLAAGTWIVPTETLFENYEGDLDALVNRPETRFLPRTLLERYTRSIAGRNDDPSDEKLLELRKHIILALHEAGVGLLLGSDSPQVFNVPGPSIHRELQAMVAAGLSPLDAIAMGTVNPARFFGMEDEFGRIAPGLAADLVLLGSNPLEDIRNTADIRGVMVGGRWLDADERARRLAAIAEH